MTRDRWTTAGLPISLLPLRRRHSCSESDLDVIEHRRPTTPDTNQGFKPVPGGMVSYGGLRFRSGPEV